MKALCLAVWALSLLAGRTLADCPTCRSGCSRGNRFASRSDDDSGRNGNIGIGFAGNNRGGDGAAMEGRFGGSLNGPFRPDMGGLRGSGFIGVSPGRGPRGDEVSRFDRRSSGNFGGSGSLSGGIGSEGGGLTFLGRGSGPMGGNIGSGTPGMVGIGADLSGEQDLGGVSSGRGGLTGNLPGNADVYDGFSRGGYLDGSGIRAENENSRETLGMRLRRRRMERKRRRLLGQLERMKENGLIGDNELGSGFGAGVGAGARAGAAGGAGASARGSGGGGAHLGGRGRVRGRIRKRLRAGIGLNVGLRVGAGARLDAEGEADARAAAAADAGARAGLAGNAGLRGNALAGAGAGTFGGSSASGGSYDEW